MNDRSSSFQGGKGLGESWEIPTGWCWRSYLLASGGKRLAPTQGWEEDCDLLSPCHHCCLLPCEGRQRAAMPVRMAAEQWVQGSLTPSRVLGFRAWACSAGWHVETLN